MDIKNRSQPLRILYVEDSENDFILFHRAFQKRQPASEISHYVQAEEALEMIVSDPSTFDLIVADYKLPGMSGLELCKEVIERKIPIPLVLLTGVGTENLAVEALDAGVADYLVKDLSLAYLDLLPIVLPRTVWRHRDSLARKQAEETLRKAYEEMEMRVEERTAELVKANEQLQQEIVERKRVEKELRESEATARALLNAPTDLVMLLDKNGTFLDVNEATAGRFDKSIAELVGACAWDLFEPEVAERRKAYTDEAIQSGKPIQFEDERQGRWWDSIVYPAFDSKGKVTRIAIVARETTERKLAEEKLRESKERYRSLVNNIGIGVSLISPNMEILTLNNQMKEWFPHIDPEKRPLCYRSFNEPPREELCSYCPTIQTLQDGRVHESIAETPAGDEIRNYRIVSSPIKDEKGNTVAAINMVDDITERKRTEDHIRELSQELITAQEFARQKISRDLHDHLAQNLAGLKICLHSLFAYQQEIPDEGRQKIAELSEKLEQSIKFVREMAYDLHPTGLEELGLVHTVRQYCADFAKKNGLKTVFFSVGMDDLKIDFDTNIALYRLAREGLTNIRKHADASQVTVRLSAALANIYLHIEDNGKGFDVKKRLKEAFREKRMGIRSMEQRVAHLNGKIEIVSHLLQGTKIVVKIPYPRKTNG